MIETKHMTAEMDTGAKLAVPANNKIRKILYIIDSMFGVGGAELALLRMVKHLPPDRFKCCVVTFHTSESARPLLDQFPCPVYHWQLNNAYDAKAWKVGRQLYEFVKQEEFDVVHTIFETSDLWAGPIAKAAGAKVLVSSRRDMGILRRSHHKVGYRLLSGVYDQIQTVSESVRQYTIDNDKVDPARILAVHNGIDAKPHALPAEVERMRRELRLDPSLPVVVCVANFRQVKGIDVLLRAAQLARTQAPAQYLIVGHFGKNAVDSAYTESVLALNKELKNDGSVRFLGESNEVPTLLKLADLFVLPSRSEGLSNALLEAMQMGLPCVATAVGGNPEVVVEGKTGFLVPSEDHQAMAEKIVLLLKDSAMCKKMGEESRERILRHFTSEAMVAKILAAYEQLFVEKRLQS